MDNSQIIIICSLILNIGLIVERSFKRVKKSKCCGSELEMQSTPTSSQEQNTIELKNISTTV